jgi:succinyl-CoA synthetase beta subunit
MKIHEYQGKELLRKYGVPVPRGVVARSSEEAYHAAKELATDVVVVKAQIHAGGRGKGGGVKLAKSADEAQELARQMLGMKLVTHQTGPEGREVRVLLIEEGLPIFKETIDPAVGFRPFQARKLAFALGLPAELVNQAAKFMQSLYTAYEQMDASLLEINPFLLTKDKRLIALDAKVNFDDNALYRHKEFLDLRDLNEEEPLEIEASKYDLNYIKLDGNIACMVNGAGLAMATMDIIKLAGGEPANFLDVGGGASQERVEAAFRILLADENVRAVLINIFGGIVRCDMVARGVVGAAQNLGVKVPVVVRLEGTNVEEGQRVIRESGLNFTVANGMKDAAEKVVAASAG